MSLTELSKRLDLDVTKIKLGDLQRVSMEPLSLDAPMGADGNEGDDLGGYIADEISLTPEQNMARKDLEKMLKNLIDMLSPRERQVITMRMGLGGTMDHTLENIGKTMGITRERVRQIEAKALEQMREWGGPMLNDMRSGGKTTAKEISRQAKRAAKEAHRLAMESGATPDAPAPKTPDETDTVTLEA